MHTPGPWRVSTGSVYVDDGEEWPTIPIAHMDREIGNGTKPVERDANARLIASAPSLLSALEEIARREGAYNRDPRIHAENTIDNMERIARTAIAAAKGE